MSDICDNKVYIYVIANGYTYFVFPFCTLFIHSLERGHCEEASRVLGKVGGRLIGAG